MTILTHKINEQLKIFDELRTELSMKKGIDDDDCREYYIKKRNEIIKLPQKEQLVGLLEEIKNLMKKFTKDELYNIDINKKIM